MLKSKEIDKRVEFLDYSDPLCDRKCKKLLMGNLTPNKRTTGVMPQKYFQRNGSCCYEKSPDTVKPA